MRANATPHPSAELTPSPPNKGEGFFLFLALLEQINCEKLKLFGTTSTTGGFLDNQNPTSLNVGLWDFLSLHVLYK